MTREEFFSCEIEFLNNFLHNNNTKQNLNNITYKKQVELRASKTPLDGQPKYVLREEPEITVSSLAGVTMESQNIGRDSNGIRGDGTLLHWKTIKAKQKTKKKACQTKLNCRQLKSDTMSLSKSVRKQQRKMGSGLLRRVQLRSRS